MTVKDLSQLTWLKQEIELDTERLEELEAAAYAPRIQKLDGMPKSPGNGDTVCIQASELAELRATIEEKLRRCIEERVRLEQYIADIPDSQTRLIFKLHFERGLSWYHTAIELGGRNTPHGVKQRVFRYVRENP